MEEIEALLAQHAGRSLDDERDRRAVAYGLSVEINHAIDKNFCDACGHLEEVHLPSGCIAGCETECSCEGFHREEDDE